MAGGIMLALFSLTIFAQQAKNQEQKAKNLKVLSKSISHEDLDKQMDFYCTSLNVKCNYCHAASKTRPGKLDFAEDSNANHKEDGRRMILLTKEINEKYFGAQPTDNPSIGAINCYTCHRGQEFPTTPEFDSLLKKPHPILKSPWLNNGSGR